MSVASKLDGAVVFVAAAEDLSKLRFRPEG
jgi:hypothetical protein